MQIYLIGGPATPAGSGGGTVDHTHSGWETPVDQGDALNFRVTHGNYQAGTLEIAIAAIPLGEEGFTLQFPPAFVQSNPSQGLFRLNGPLPPGWALISKYVYR